MPSIILVLGYCKVKFIKNKKFFLIIMVAFNKQLTKTNFGRIFGKKSLYFV